MNTSSEPRPSRRHVIVSVLNVFLMLLAIAIAGFVVLKKTVALEAEFAAHSERNRKLHLELTELQYHQGYGGFIHNFKNYVIRQESSYLDEARADIERVNQVLDRLSESAVAEPALGQAVADVRSVFAQYQDKLDTAESMTKQGYGTKEIDARVKVADMPAEAAEAVLIGGAIDADTAFDSHVRSEFTTLRRLQYLVGILVFPAIISALINLFIQFRRK